MRRTNPSRGFLAVIGLMWAVGLVTPGSGQVVDRMLAIVDGQVITAGDLREHRALAAFFEETDVPGNEEELLQRVIETRLIGSVVARVPGIRASDQEVEEYLARYTMPEDIEYPLSETVLRRSARERIERIRYFDIRFPQEVTEDEIRSYYETVWTPFAEGQGLAVFTLEEVRDFIEVLVITEKTQAEAAAWAATLLGRSQVEVVD